MPEFPFAGLNLALTTPFDAEGRIAFDSLPGHIERYPRARRGATLRTTLRRASARFLSARPQGARPRAAAVVVLLREVSIRAPAGGATSPASGPPHSR